MEPNIKNYYDLIADTENTWDYPEEDKTFYIDTKFVGDEEIDYRIILGNEKIVFIKAGAGGSACGFENKYLRMAERIHKNLGCTVICASNPDVPHSDIDEKEIRWLIFEMELSGFELYFIGTSDGAYHNLSLAKRFPETKKWVGINTSFIDASDLSKKLLSLTSFHNRNRCFFKQFVDRNHINIQIHCSNSLC